MILYTWEDGKIQNNRYQKFEDKFNNDKLISIF